MKKLGAISLAFLFGLVPQHVTAASFDGSVPLLCATIEVMECGPDGKCERRTAESVNLPQFVKIDVKARTISAAGAGGRTAPIQNLESTDGRLVLHGGQGGRGWSIVIAGETGKLSAGVVDDQVGFVIFGACTPS